jgi:Fic family protein
MKVEQFKSGTWQQQYQYKSFQPVPVNVEWCWENPQINTLLERANKVLGELNAFSLIVPDIDLFIQMHITKEAQTSSRIEGTQTAFDEAVMPEEQIAVEKRDDWREVRNYVNAMNEAVEELKRLPLSNRLLKQTHATLMSGVRGKTKQPGEFRISQNWIGGSDLSDAAFIPPHQDSVLDLMSDLEKFWHNEDIHVPHLIRAAISHYQFETIHPFLDGNGRIGRLMIPLYLISHGLLEKPSLYMSDFFERNRASYYDALMKVRISHDLTHWLLFFLNGVEQTARKGREVFRQLLALRAEFDKQVLTMGKRGELASRLLTLIYRKPVLTAKDVQTTLGITTPTANALVKVFLQKGLLKELTGQQRGRIYVCEPYLKVFSS